MSAFTSKRNPAYVNLVNDDGVTFGTSENPISVNIVSGTPETPSEYVAVVGSETLYAGTKSVGTTAEAMATTQAITRLTVQNDPASTNNLLIGNASTQSIKLVPGANIEIEVNDISKVYVKAESGTVTVNYLAGS